MLTRLYVDNFRCFVNFEYRPRQRELILGANGSGKSTFLDVLLLLRQIAVNGVAVDDLPMLANRTRWMQQPEIVFELDADLDGLFHYRLVIAPTQDPLRQHVAEETVHFKNSPLLRFSEGNVQTFNDRGELVASFSFDPRRSAFAVLGAGNTGLGRLKTWLTDLCCFRINPFTIAPAAPTEALGPNVDLSNFVAWYRHLVQAQPRENRSFLRSLEQSIEGLRYLPAEPVGINNVVLAAEFDGGQKGRVYLNELSDGQRCLIGLYAILHFVVAKGRTVVIDEPDNFIALREIQPWLVALDDAVEESRGQVMIISHHPEILNQWAPSSGTQFSRDGFGPVRVRRFEASPEPALTAAELVSRGWDGT
ncbi:MAG: AAA family ATPase [Bryobacteraceae bacterium]